MSNFKWTLEKLQEAANEYPSRDKFRKGNPNACQAAERKGLLAAITRHMPRYVDRSGDKNSRFKWTREKLQMEADKCTTKTEFRENGNTAFQTALKRGILQEICKNLIGGVHYWSYEELAQEALKHKTRREFEIANDNAYQAATGKKIMDQICVHMGNPVGGVSLAETELFNIIKTIFIDTKTLRDRKVKIKRKPHIKGFHIDIFIPELKLGIEYDGDYYHSFEYMRNDPKRLEWSDADIRNYHQIKDAWFATKGIRILHVKEADWNSNKQACIDKCLAFLGINLEKVA